MGTPQSSYTSMIKWQIGLVESSMCCVCDIMINQANKIMKYHLSLRCVIFSVFDPQLMYQFFPSVKSTLWIKFFFPPFTLSPHPLGWMLLVCVSAGVIYIILYIYICIMYKAPTSIHYSIISTHYVPSVSSIPLHNILNLCIPYSCELIIYWLYTRIGK